MLWFLMYTPPYAILTDVEMVCRDLSVDLLVIQAARIVDSLNVLVCQWR